MTDYIGILNNILEIYRNKIRLESRGFDGNHLQQRLDSKGEGFKSVWFKAYPAKHDSKEEVICAYGNA